MLLNIIIIYLALTRLLYCRARVEPNQNKIHIAYNHSTKIHSPLSFILCFGHDHSTKNYDLHWLISFICTRPFDQHIWSSFIYFFFFVHDQSTKWYGPHCFISFIYTRPFETIYGFLSFIFSFANDHSTKIYGPLSFTLSLVDDYSTKN